ncbi:(S)-ureidoglycine aminohydrolase [Deltaproteobacteria bacterium Smac51]|nr:(S)-ureidoglycine aminohydrolase [Deltaproteobacteria bacterium Smac51]
MPYPGDILKSRAVIKPGLYAVIPPEGLVYNVIPGFEGCRLTILCTPKLGAGFVQIIGEAAPGGGTSIPYGLDDDVECFVYFLEGPGTLKVGIGAVGEELRQGGYAYAPAGAGLTIKNISETPGRFLLYKQRYIPHPHPGRQPWPVFGQIHELKEMEYTGMANVFITDLLPTDEAFDMNMHILSFLPGGSHEFVETHVQEHGAYIYEGEGLYLLDDQWLPVKRGDFIWMGAYCKQCCYAVGRGRLSYIYSKDCNRDVEI